MGSLWAGIITSFIFHHAFFTGDATEYSKHLFRVLDTDKDNMVSWKEVMVGFHQLSPSGDPDQKLRLVYNVSKSKSNVSTSMVRVVKFLSGAVEIQ